MPGRKTIGRRVDKLYAAAVELVSETLQLTEQLPCLTTDAWTSPAQDGYVSLTLHTLKADLSAVVTASIGVWPLEPPHDAARTAEALRRMLLTLGWDGLGEATVTTDSASVMRATVKSHLRWEWMPCASHVIN